MRYGVVKTMVSKRPWSEWAYLPSSMIEYDVPVAELEQPSTSTSYKLGERTLKRTSPLMKGNDVEELQTRLNAFGFDCGTVDGEFGKNTEKGVIAFQSAAGIEVDGKFGKESKAALDAYSKSQDVTENDSEPDDTFETHPVDKGDSLWSIAQKFYGDGTKWSVIAEANGISGTIIHIGDVLKIPKVQ